MAEKIAHWFVIGKVFTFIWKLCLEGWPSALELVGVQVYQEEAGAVEFQRTKLFADFDAKAATL